MEKTKLRGSGYLLRRADITCIRRAAIDWTPQSRQKLERPIDTWRYFTLKEVKTNGRTWRKLKQLSEDRMK